MNEDQTVEWKEAWRDEHLRWICGFANAEGGTLVIGRGDRGRAVGSKAESKAHSKAESPPKPLTFHVLRLLGGATLGKARRSGDLNAAVRRLLAEKLVAYTLPERPTSRVQAYRIIAKGKARLAEQG